MEPKVSIIILNWNGWQDTIECIESCSQINYSNYELIIVDNGSEDDSINNIEKYCKGDLEVKSNFFSHISSNKPFNILKILEKELYGADLRYKMSDRGSDVKTIIIKNNENYGFARGCNIGIKFAIDYLDPEYILLLNNDTVVHSDFLKELIICFKKEKNIGAIQSALYYYDEEIKVQTMGGTLNLITGGESDIKSSNENLIDCDRLIGASMLIKADVLKKIGLIDDRYFLYMEETDWCYRAKKAGYSLKGCKNSKVWHKVHSSSGKDNPKLDYYWTRNMLLFYRKNCKRYLPTFLVFFAIKILKQLAFLIINKRSINGIIYGLCDGLLGKKGILKRNL